MFFFGQTWDVRGGDLLTAVPAAGGVPASVRSSNGLVLSHVLCRVNSLRNLLINIFFKFPRAIKLTGPFVTMIFAMITGDMFTFSIIYIIFLFGFSQAFHFIMKSTDEEGMYANYMTTWIALFHMTLGEYEVVLLFYCTYFLEQIFTTSSTVRRTWWESLPFNGQNGVCSFPNPNSHPAAEHVDCHDGQHLRHRDQHRGQGVPQTGDG